MLMSNANYELEWWRTLDVTKKYTRVLLPTPFPALADAWFVSGLLLGHLKAVMVDATKAFVLSFSEALWTERHPRLIQCSFVRSASTDLPRRTDGTGSSNV